MFSKVTQYFVFIIFNYALGKLIFFLRCVSFLSASLKTKTLNLKSTFKMLANFWQMKFKDQLALLCMTSPVLLHRK